MESEENQQELNQQMFIFGNLFLLANRLQVVCDQYLYEDNITTKQWLLLAAISQFKDTSPTLSEVSEMIGSSRQNIKQLALKLEKKEFLKIRKDEEDTRAYRLVLTEKCNLYWKSREKMDNKFIADIFNGITSEETNILSDCIPKVLVKITEIYECNSIDRRLIE
jgi:DNA-binding MarR family transcriptional regulator